ncbi:MAG: PQQ-binding-like beta-propeller repeat protein [Eubacterium sp.]|nr:PQQ-binding-like beta-propeller repeat protein [Candidatus Colimonas fimequi]
MNKRLLSIFVAIVVAITMTMGGAATVFADEGLSTKKVGELAWSKELGGYPNASTSPVYDDGYVYTVNGTNLLKINAQTGEEEASAPITGSIDYGTIPVTIGGGKVFIPLSESSVSIVDKATMEELKVVKFADEESHQTIAPIIYDEGTNAIYVGSWVKRKGGTYSRISLDTYEATELIKDANGFYWAGAYIEGSRLIVGANSAATEEEVDAAPCSGQAAIYCIDLNGTYDDISNIEPALAVDGSVCSGIIKSNGSYYFSTKGKKLYECSMDEDGVMAIERTISLPGVSTCTPLVEDGMIYVGNTEGVSVIDQATGQVEETLKTPGDAKFIALHEGNVYCTYNKEPGGIYSASEGKDYFVPGDEMKEFCISSIAVNGDMMYYRNDSGYLMAVKSVFAPKEEQVITANNVNKTITSSASNLNAKAAGKLTYTSSKPSVATVSASGVVTPKAIGTTIVTINAAETEDYLAAAKKITVTITPKTASGVKVTAGKKKMTVKWTKDTKATGYRIAYTKDSKFKTGIKYVNITKYSTYKKVIKSLTKGKYYYVKVREYKTVSGMKIYGPYSSAKKVKIK